MAKDKWGWNLRGGYGRGGEEGMEERRRGGDLREGDDRRGMREGIGGDGVRRGEVRRGCGEKEEEMMQGG